MLETAPRRPALLPALFFVAAFWIASPPAVFALGALVWAGLRSSLRPIDAILFMLAGMAGVFGAWQADQARVHAGGNIALALPLGTPFEGSWNGVLEASPKAIDEVGWLIRVAARPEGRPSLARPVHLALEVPLHSDAEQARLSSLRAGDRVRTWARVRFEPETRPRGTIKSPRLIELLDRSDGAPRYALQRVRDRLHARLRALYEPDRRLVGFLAAVLLGERSARDPRWEERLRACGLAHYLAISGLHVGIVAAFLFGVVRRVSRAPWWRLLVIGGPLCLFGVMVGGATPVQRAVGAATGLLLARALGREGDPLNRLACLAFAVGLLSPSSAETPAYALSFAATAGILVSSGSSGVLRISLAAYFATAPLSALYFGQLAPWAPLANFVALPFLVIVLTAGYASLLCAGIPYLGAAATGLTHFGYTGLERIAQTFDGRVLSPLYTAEPHPLLVVIVLASVFFGDRPSRDEAPWPGAVWSPAHGHWH